MINLPEKSKEYYKKNPSYHVEDAGFKWNNFKNSILKSEINLSQVRNIGEIGCGSGQILSLAKKSGLFKETEYVGYDTNLDAIILAKSLDGSIKYLNEDLVNKNLEKKFDILIVSDVFEHVDDYYSFLQALRKKAKYLIFNIPLQMNLTSLLRRKNVFEISYNQVGHLHFFSSKTAKLALEKNGYSILYTTYARNRFFELKKQFTIKKFLIAIPEFLLGLINEDLSCDVFGGYSLVAITKSD